VLARLAIDDERILTLLLAGAIELLGDQRPFDDVGEVHDFS
jgi:hypothetical protein